MVYLGYIYYQRNVRPAIMNSSMYTLMDKLKIDREIAEMKKHPIDYSDIPERKSGAHVRLVHKEFLDTLPPDIVQELARRRLRELQTAGYEIQRVALIPGQDAHSKNAPKTRPSTCSVTRSASRRRN